MGNKLTDAQRRAIPCPDCGNATIKPPEHDVTCRRIAMEMPDSNGGPPLAVRRLKLQCGPPWSDWPEDVEPVNPRAAY